MTVSPKRHFAGISAIICGSLLCLIPGHSVRAQSVTVPPVKAHLRNVTSRQIIKEKLDRIVIPVVAFDDVPLPEVIKFIQAEIAKSDPDGKTLNFMLNPYLVEQASTPVPPASTDPTQAPAAPAPTATPTDLDTVLIRINPPLRDLKLAHVLDAVMKSASSPIRFTIEDYAVVFFRSSPEAVALMTRRVRVNPNTFQQGLQGVTATTVFNPGQNSTGGATISTVTAAPGGGSGGISGVTTPATR